MNYSEDPRMCRVDFWHSSGKWGYTEAVEWTGSWEGLIHEGLKGSLIDHFGDNPRMVGMRATCLEPHHKHPYPISILVEKDWWG